MDSRNYWKRFLSTGSVSDYVNYKNAEKLEAEQRLEEDYEKFDQRFGYLREQDEGSGQGGNNSF